jgi:hypothetical protein
MINQTNNYIKKALKGKKFYIKDDCDGQEYCLYAGKTGGFYLIDATEEITRALQKQQDIIKKCLPEESKDGDEYCDCFNECRQQFLDNLSKKGINLN